MSKIGKHPRSCFRKKARGSGKLQWSIVARPSWPCVCGTAILAVCSRAGSPCHAGPDLLWHGRPFDYAQDKRGREFTPQDAFRRGWKPVPQRGFTLIELLLVLVILAALAAIVVPKFTKRSEQARITAARTDIANLEVALDAFEIDTGKYPTTNEGLKMLIEEPTNVKGWRGPYIKRGVPNDPWGQQYVYKQPGQYNKYGYDLYSFGPDGRQGGGDDIDNWSSDKTREEERYR